MSGSDRGSQCANTPTAGSSTCRHHHRSASSRRHPPTRQNRSSMRNGSGPGDTGLARADRRTHARHLCACHGAHAEPSYALRLGVASATSLQAVGLGPCERSLRASHPVLGQAGRREEEPEDGHAAGKAESLAIDQEQWRGRTDWPGPNLAWCACCRCCRRSLPPCDGASSPRTGQVLLPVLRSRPGRVPLSILAVRIRVARR